MKLYFKLILILLISSVLLCLPFLVNATEQNKPSLIISNQFESAKQNNKIIESFKKTIMSKRETYDLENMELSYPDSYGGSYLDNDGKLVVLVNGNDDNFKQKLRTVTLNDNLQFKKAEYSYAELTGLINQVISYQEAYYKSSTLTSSYDIAIDIIDCKLDDINNKVVVGIKNLDNNKRKLFNENISNSDAIILQNQNATPIISENDIILDNTATDKLYEYSNKVLSTSIVLQPGMGIHSNNGREYSIGFPVRRTISNGYQYGFVTAGHFMDVGNNLFDAETLVHNCAQVRLQKLGGKYDVSFAALANNAACSNTISNTAYSLVPNNEEIDNPIVGKLVYLYGRNTRSSGKILSTNYAYYNRETGTSFNGMIQTDYRCLNGDSGGLVASSGSNNYTKIQEGIHSGYIKLDNGSIIGSYYCSAANIVNLWYLQCY